MSASSAESTALLTGEWQASVSSALRLKELVDEGALPPKEIIAWHATTGELFSTQETHKVVVF
ncbi:hypothetical protein E2562_032092 [Oryza meyeriana var. granulata]|uniref:Uncharacterized protein n=1 Tax=Oryza meyeriana var. granulata TaxID=110450 RepID=A0A6G1CIL9_9ORYZ|nr:hypothetical protein E2562_032092 [Oryza meyeriana var. granulata]